MPVALFASQSGSASAYVASDSYVLFLGGGIEQLGIQALGAASIAGWAIAASAILFLLIKYTVGLRVSEEEEHRGLDIVEHGVEAYPDFGGAVVLGLFAEVAGGSDVQAPPPPQPRPPPGESSAGGES